MNKPYRIVVMLSGGGTTLQNLIDRIEQQELSFEIAGVISSKASALGVERAKKAKLPVNVLARKSFATIEEFSEANFRQIREWQADLVCLAGYLQLLPIPMDYEGKVINIHPSLLPAFGGHKMYGHHVHEAVIAYGAKYSGCTVHFADNQYDQGPIIDQAVVRVDPDDTPETLAKRVFLEECMLYPEIIEAFAQGLVTVNGRQVTVIRPRCVDIDIPY